VERANRTHREEFYELEEIELSLVEHNKQLSRWEHTYNYVRPHQGIDYLTPNEYYRNWLDNTKGKRRQCVTNVLNEYTLQFCFTLELTK